MIAAAFVLLLGILAIQTYLLFDQREALERHELIAQIQNELTLQEIVTTGDDIQDMLLTGLYPAPDSDPETASLRREVGGLRTEVDGLLQRIEALKACLQAPTEEQDICLANP